MQGQASDLLCECCCSCDQEIVCESCEICNAGQEPQQDAQSLSYLCRESKAVLGSIAAVCTCCVRSFA